MYPQDLRYTKDHEWIRVEGARGVVGITYFAQEQLGDVVFVELPKVGTRVEQGKTFGVVESVKTASDLFAPVSGTVVEVNEKLIDRPELVNQDPYGEGWMIVVEMSDPSQVASLLTAEQYEALLPK
ncbi:MAG TPA: glycine cleavage system protein GcvH [Chloroflexota bacterium]|nr:glycine cleavage system protein GcvH [Chloroflexota bacterium]